MRIQTVGRESILRDPRSMRAHVINGSAARIWELCDGRTLDEVVDAFSAAFDSPPPSVREDVAAVIESFRGLDLLQ